MGKTVFLICNAHLDPVWQWEWEEGAAEALSTFRTAVRFCKEYEGFVFNHNEALLYMWIEEYEPALFEEIRTLVKAGRWHVMGGWHLQPDCNMPSGEAFVRQIAAGRKYFWEKFGVFPATAINFDPFGHSRGLVQILKKTGFDSYMVCRPYESFLHLPDTAFRWVGFDGSEVLARRFSGYNTGLGKAAAGIRKTAEACPDGSFDGKLWGVGNHGGGASKKDLDDIAALAEELAADGTVLLHATPEQYFDAEKKRRGELPAIEGDLNPWAPGCYTSMIRVKQKYRALENALFTAERMAAAAKVSGADVYRPREFEDALYDLNTVQFHDMLPGSSIQPSEEMALRMLHHGEELISRAKARAFFALAAGQMPPPPDRIPIMVFNPHPYPVEDDFFCEMMLWDQNRDGDFFNPQVVQGETPLPTQCEKEFSSHALDWRKRPVFHATLAPMTMNRFDCTYTRLPAKPEPAPVREEAGSLVLENETAQVRIDKKNGLLGSYRVNGRELLAGPCALEVYADDFDPWAMRVTAFPDKIGAFSLLTPEQAAAHAGLPELAPLRVTDNGAVRTVVEGSFGYGASRAIVRYIFSRFSPALKLELRIQWADCHKLVKLTLPTAIEAPVYAGETAYGEQRFETEGRENCAQKYVILKNEEAALAVCTDSVYGSSARGGELSMTLLRSPAYCAHPEGDLEVLRKNRYTPHMEQGERQYSFLILGGDAKTVADETPRAALVMNEAPMALSFYPSGAGERPKPLFTLSGDRVLMTAAKPADDGNGYIARLFNPFDRPAGATLESPALGCSAAVPFGPFEIKTLRATAAGIAETDLLEGAFPEF